jgi:hypothetical protein
MALKTDDSGTTGLTGAVLRGPDKEWFWDG